MFSFSIIVGRRILFFMIVLYVLYKGLHYIVIWFSKLLSPLNIIRCYLFLNRNFFLHVILWGFMLKFIFLRYYYMIHLFKGYNSMVLRHLQGWKTINIINFRTFSLPPNQIAHPLFLMLAWHCFMCTLWLFQYS